MAFKLNRDRAKRKQEEITTRSEGDFVEIPQGWSWYYILPPWSEVGDIWKETERHGLHVCPKRAGVRDCVICKEIRRRIKKGDRDFADEFQLKSNAFVNVIQRQNIKKMDPDCVKILRLSPGVFNDLVEWVNDEDEDPSDPQRMFAFGIKRKGTGKRTRYKTKFAERPVNASKYLTDKFLEEGTHDLDTIRAVQIASDKELRRAIKAGDSWNADDYDESGEDEFEDDDDLDTGTAADDDADDVDDLEDDDELDLAGDDADDDDLEGDDLEEEPGDVEEDSLFDDPPGLDTDEEEGEIVDDGDDLDDELDLGDDEEELEDPPDPPKPAKKPGTKKTSKPAGTKKPGTRSSKPAKTTKTGSKPRLKKSRK